MENEYEKPTTPFDQWINNSKLVNNIAKTMNALFCTVNKNEFPQVNMQIRN